MKHTRKIRSELNQQYILKLGIVSEFDYKLKIFDLGIQFLQELFTEDEHWFQEFSYSKNYWNWWLFEWKHQEDNMIKIMDHHHMKIDRGKWNEWMEEMIHSKSTEHGFQNYIKNHKTKTTCHTSAA